MKVIASDSHVGEADITLDFYDGQQITLKIKTEPVSELIKHSDFITLHVPAQNGYVIGKEEIAQMKNGAAIINAARGGVIDEVALIEALDSGKLSFAGLDTFEKEPTPAIKVLMNHKISLSPHIGAATEEAQDRIGTELAEQIKEILL
jgi:D-3-phosphoglycerate dehydrogenase